MTPLEREQAGPEQSADARRASFPFLPATRSEELRMRVPSPSPLPPAVVFPSTTSLESPASPALRPSAMTHAGATPRASEIQPTIWTSAESEPWRYLGLGLITAPLFALPIVGFMGWFLAALVHEMGHASVAWLCGMPAIPAISLEGHAAAVHSEQMLPLVFLIAAGLVFGAWRMFEGRARWIALGLVVTLYPALALTDLKELVHLIAGHAGELAFATLCLWKTLDGGFTESKLERALYGMLGWYLLGRNVILCWGLMTSATARAHYDENGSFGLTNDLIRVAEDVLHCPLQGVAFCMLLACLMVLPAALLAWRVSSRMRE